MQPKSSSSITTAESFLARAQRGEAYRVILWLGVLGILLVADVVRRALGGHVMSTDSVFYPKVAVLSLGVIVQCVMLAHLARANRMGTLVAGWLNPAAAVFDISVVASTLSVSQWLSPRGAVPALSGPSLLLLPLLILTSVLRLRPTTTLFLGIASALVSWGLTLRAMVVTDAPFEQYPTYAMYGVLLLLTGFAGTLVARTMRLHVIEGVAEAVAREAADAKTAAIERDLSVARDIQKGLLPSSVPDFNGFDVAGFNRACDLTGGDYYDWQLLPDGRLLTVLADVTGHGIGPALVMAVCRAYSRATANLIDDPTELMVRINRLLAGDLPSDRFITLATAMIQPGGQVQLVSAGHGPTLLYRAATGAVEEFGGDGLPLGVSVDDPYSPAIGFQMEPGDILMLVTDGFFEWHRTPDREQFGTERLVEALKNNAKEDAKTIIQRIDATVCSFVNGTRQEDDMTAVIVKRK